MIEVLISSHPELSATALLQVVKNCRVVEEMNLADIPDMPECNEWILQMARDLAEKHEADEIIDER